MYLSITLWDMQRHYEEAHRGTDAVEYSIIGMPTPQGQLNPAVSLCAASIIQEVRVESTTDAEYVCTQCQWSCTDPATMRRHIDASSDHQGAWFTVELEEELFPEEEIDISDVEEEIDISDVEDELPDI